MATTEITSGTEAGNQVVGKVVILYGNVKAVSIDGTERLLGPNSPIFAYDRIITESDGRVSITMDDAAQSQIDIGRMSHIVIDEDIFAGVSPEDVAAASAEVEQIQEALLAEDFDPTVELEAAAAGGSAAAGGGHPVPDFARVTHEGEVTSGAETIGITGDTVDPIPGAAELPDPTVDVAINAEGGLVPEGVDAVFTVTISDASEGAQLSLGLSDGTALVESDYNLTTFQYDDGSGWQDITGPITLTAGDNTLLVRTDTVADNVDEPDETFSLTAEVVNENGASASGSALATIVDGDVPSVEVSDDIRVEGDTEVFTVTVNNAAEGAELTLNMTDGTAESPADYNATTFEYSTDDGASWQGIGGPITLTEGNHELLVRTDTAVDDRLEGDENFFLNASLTNEGGGAVADTGEGIIVEGTVPPEPEPEPEPVTLNVTDDLIPEGDDGVFTVTVGSAPEGAQLNLGLSEGSADDPQDYNAVKFEYNDGSGWTPVTGPIDIPAGDSSIQVRTDTVDDTIDENNENFFVNASVSNSEGSLVADTGTGTIIDDDVPPPPNNPPVANPDGTSTPEDIPVTIPVTGNDTDLDGNLAPNTAAVVTGPSNGSLTNNGNGSFTYTPNPNYNGPDSFTYSVQDTTGATSNTTTVTIDVTPVNDPPEFLSVADQVADPDITTPNADTYTYNLQENRAAGMISENQIDAFDADGDTLTYSIESGNDTGLFSINSSTGEISTTRTLDNGDVKQHILGIKVIDGNSGEDTATVTVNIGNVNDPPEFLSVADQAADPDITTPNADTYTYNLNENRAAGMISENQIDAYDQDGDTLTYSIESGNGGGLFSINSSTGEISTIRTLDDADVGQHVLGIKVVDGNSGEDTATVTVNVANVNDPPEFLSVADQAADPDNTTPNADTYSYDVDEGTTFGTMISQNQIDAFDADGDTLTYSIESGNGDGLFSINSSTGEISLTKTIDDADIGTYDLGIKVIDGNGGEDTATVTINLNDINELPEVENKHVWMPDETLVNLASNVDPSPNTSDGSWNSTHGYALKPSIGADPEGDTLTVDVDLPASFDGTFWYNNGSTWVQLTGDASGLTQAEFESLHYKPDGDNDGDEITLNYTVSDGTDTTSPATITIHTVERDVSPSDPVTIGEPGGSPMTSGNTHSGTLTFSTNSTDAMNNAIAADTANVSIKLDYHPQNTTLGDADSLPDAGKGVPSDYLADFDITVEVDGNLYIINYNAVTDSNYEAWDVSGGLDTTWSLVDDVDNGGKVWEASFNLDEAYLVTSTDNKDQVTGVDETQTLADYLASNPVEASDTWTINYNDGTSGNEQARFAQATFTYDPEEVYDITVTGTPESDLIYGGVGDDELSGAGEDDVIFGREGDDDIFGGADNDTIYANDGVHDTIGDGGANDTLNYDSGIDSLVADPDDPV